MGQGKSIISKYWEYLLQNPLITLCPEFFVFSSVTGYNQNKSSLQFSRGFCFATKTHTHTPTSYMHAQGRTFKLFPFVCGVFIKKSDKMNWDICRKFFWMLHVVTTGAYYPPVVTTWKIFTRGASSLTTGTLCNGAIGKQ